MNHLRKALAPVTDAAWNQIDDEASRSLRLNLGARKIVDVVGPLGWDVDAAVSGLVKTIESDTDGVEAAVRQPVALAEFRTPFVMSLRDMDTADRGNPAIDTDPVIAAARSAALAEDQMVFHGVGAAGCPGIVGATPNAPITLADDPAEYPKQVADALQVLRDAGIGGPYAIALGDAEYTAVTETTEKGYPVYEHMASLLGGDIVWVPALSGAVVLSTRGGDFQLTLGEDFSIGYRSTSGDEVTLYLEESLAFQVLTPNAAVHLQRSA
jgi:uncharacterized linocin/CFP29 family protein